MSIPSDDDVIQINI